MMTPPRFEQPVRKEGSRTGLIIAIVAAVIGLPCIALIIFGFWVKGFASKNFAFVNDIITFEVVRESMFMYSDEHKGKLPQAEKWQDAIEPYYKRAKQKLDTGMMSVADISQPIEFKSEGGKVVTGMAFNQALSNKVWKDIKDPDKTVMFFEIEKPALNATMPYKALPDNTSPKILGETRGWYVLTITGESALDQSKLNHRNRRFSRSSRSFPGSTNSDSENKTN